MRTRAAILVLAAALVSTQALADCYSCYLTSQGIPYCATRNSGFQTCTANPHECYAADKCGSGWGMDPEEPIVRNRCKEERLILVSVDVKRQQRPRLVLASANYDRSAQ